MHVIQQKLLRLADSYNLGAMPLRDIGKIINEGHPQLVKHHLEQLEKKSLIDWDRERKVITKRSNGPITNSDLLIIPVVGSANCGPASAYADESIIEHIKVSRTLLKNRTSIFAIKAIGSSMNKANIEGKGIDDGDYVLIDPNEKNINSNDYVLSIIDNMANVKKIIIDKIYGQISLISESTNSYPAIYIDESEDTSHYICGKVIQVIKQSIS